MRKLLLVAGNPPGQRNVGEIILHDLLQHHGPHRCVCAVVTEPSEVQKPADLADLVFRHFEVRGVRGKRSLPGRLGSCQVLCHTVTRLLPLARRIAAQVAALAEDEGVERAWVVLNTPLLIALAMPLVGRLRIPVYPLVWDPPRYIMRLYGSDSISIRLLYRQFARAMAVARRTAVASEQMKRQYEVEFGRPCVVVRYGLRAALAAEPAAAPPIGQSTFTIGFAGSLYADDAWQAFLGALDQCSWHVHGRSIRLRILGGDVRIRVTGKANVEVYGWRSEAECSAILGQCDAFYLPYPFCGFYKEVVRLSFPTKLSTYASFGRPVIVHSPAASSLAEFFGTHPVGILWTDLDPRTLGPQLSRLVADSQFYSLAANAVAHLARTELNSAVFHRRFDEFIGPD